MVKLGGKPIISHIMDIYKFMVLMNLFWQRVTKSKIIEKYFHGKKRKMCVYWQKLNDWRKNFRLKNYSIKMKILC